MRMKLDKTLFFLSLLVLAFAYGFVSHAKQIFPYSLLKEAKIGYRAFNDVQKDESEPGIDFWDESGLTEPRATTFSKNGGRENIFVLGNEHANRDICPGTGCIAWIMDRQGNILHAWKNIPDIWAPLENRDAVENTWSAYPVGAYLYPNGDLLVSYHGRNVFPIGMGLAKFDKDSNLIWKRNGYYHHWFSVDDKDRIYIPAMKVVESPLDLDDTQKYFECKDKRFHIEEVEILDSNGNLIKEIDIYKSLMDSDLHGIFNNNGKIRSAIETCDPMHLNHVGILSDRMAQEYEGFSPGDLLLSFRSMNAVGVLSPETNLFKWFYVGAVQNQHSPRFLGNNRILIFDNLGGSESQGSSRIVAVDVPSEDAETVFPSPNSKLPSTPFFSETGGYIDLHPDQRRMLVSWTHQGLVWEIDMKSGKVLWEYVNTHPVEDRFGRLPAYTSMYVENLNFPLNGGKVP